MVELAGRTVKPSAKPTWKAWKGGYTGNHIGESYRGYKGGTRSLDYSLCRFTFSLGEGDSR